MSVFDPHAFYIYVDGSALKNPGGPGGLAGILEHPSESDEESQKIFQEGYFATTNNRMELRAVVKALEYIRKNARDLRAIRFVVVTDSMYVWQHHNVAQYWKDNNWKGEDDKSIENPNVWSEFLTARSKTGVPVEFTWHKGKKTDILKAVDGLAKAAAYRPTQIDIGYRPGKIGNSHMEKGGISTLYHATGQTEKIQIFRKAYITDQEYKIFFTLYSETEKKITEKCYTYTSPEIAVQLHRDHRYEVIFNNRDRVTRIGFHREPDHT
jgi:ribonuclease HI